MYGVLCSPNVALTFDGGAGLRGGDRHPTWQTGAMQSSSPLHGKAPHLSDRPPTTQTGTTGRVAGASFCISVFHVAFTSHSRRTRTHRVPCPTTRSVSPGALSVKCFP